MDLTIIGKFISELRKEKGWTQEQLGEKISVTNKTISRWETGTYLPPADALLAMSSLFDVSINEILTGKRLTVEEYKETAESNLAKAISESSFTLKEKLEYYQKKWLKDHIAVMVCLGVCILALLIAGLVLHESLIGYLAMLLLVLAHGWRNNAMMAYAEKKVYDQGE